MKKNECENCGKVKLSGLWLVTDTGKKIFICNDCWDKLKAVLDKLLDKSPGGQQ